MTTYYPYLVIGGGIAGITCIETLHHLDESVSIGLITCTDTVKSVTNLHRITKLIEDFDVSEKSVSEITKMIPTVTIIKGTVDFINPQTNSVQLSDGREVSYGKLCVCTGGRPRLIETDNPFVIGIRDTESVESFKQKLSGCKRIAIVGNGGIATELVHELADCELLWIIKDSYISASFFDAGAAKFLLNTVSTGVSENSNAGGADKISRQRHHYVVDGKSYTTETKSVHTEKSNFGGALGPDWALNMHMRGSSDKRLEVVYDVQVTSVTIDREKLDQLWTDSAASGNCRPCDYNVAVTLSDGTVHFCDLVVSATGVIPEYPRIVGADWTICDSDGGIVVDEGMNTGVPGIFAAGDCCSAGWQWADHWFQMRLWHQARCMAFQAAKGMFASLNNHPAPMLDFSFELFTHVTKFFGYSVILLGLYNGQNLQLANNPRAELLIRTSPGTEYIKCVVVDGRIHGAMLIGDTELAETLEDLILDEIDISQYGEHLLDPNIDIVDYFD